MSPAKPHSLFRADIQALRGWAVLLVVLYHARIGGVNSGFFGVDIFFVISGYLITNLVAKAVSEGRFRFSDFYGRRAKRLLPAAYAVFVASLIVGMALLSPRELLAFGKQLAGAVTFTGNIVLWKQTGYFDGSAELKPLLHVWSLAIEEQYYLVLPAALAFTPRRFWGWGIAGVLTASLALCLYFVDTKTSATFFLLPTRAWELAIGSVGALWLDRNWPAIRLLYWPALMALLLIPFGTYGNQPALAAVAICLASLAVILARRSADNVVGASLARIGDVSYSLYLIHWPLFAFARNVYAVEPPTWLRLALLVLAGVSSLLLYRYVERPVWKSELRFTPRRVAGVAVVSLLLAAAGVGVSLQQRAATYAYRPNTGLGPSCNYGNTFTDVPQCRTSKQPSVMVWGDSFAMHVAPMLPDQVQATRHRCAPFVNLAPVNGKKFSKKEALGCLKFNAAVLRYLGTHPEIKTVVISSRYEEYLPSTEYGNTVLTARGVERSSVDKAVEAMLETVNALHAFGKHVVVVSPPPAADGFDPGRCLERQQFGRITFGRKDCNIGLAEYHHSRAAVRTFLDRLPKMGIGVVRLDALLCNDRDCVTSLDGAPLYRDEGHLSYAGSELLARKFGLAERIIADAE